MALIRLYFGFNKKIVKMEWKIIKVYLLNVMDITTTVALDEVLRHADVALDEVLRHADVALDEV